MELLILVIPLPLLLISLSLFFLVSPLIALTFPIVVLIILPLPKEGVFAGEVLVQSLLPLSIEDLLLALDEPIDELGVSGLVEGLDLFFDLFHSEEVEVIVEGSNFLLVVGLGQVGAVLVVVGDRLGGEELERHVPWVDFGNFVEEIHQVGGGENHLVVVLAQKGLCSKVPKLLNPDFVHNGAALVFDLRTYLHRLVVGVLGALEEKPFHQWLVAESD